MPEEQINVGGGNNMFAPNATEANQYYYLNGSVEPSEPQPAVPETVVVLGAGVDSVMGIPSSASLIPHIVDYIETGEGQQVDAALRKAIGGVRFHFEKFVSNAIDNLAKNLQVDTIVHEVAEELNTNANLDESHIRWGNLVVRLFSKIRDVKNGAAIDEETSQLIEELIGTPVRDEAIIDFSHINYTETFKSVIVEILQKSIRESSNPILRHVYKNTLDIEQLLSQYFYGFYSGMPNYIRTYLYISWMLWAYLVHEEQGVRGRSGAEAGDAGGHGNTGLCNVYDQLTGRDCRIVTFNYTSFANECSDEALYFNGNLMRYVDIENKNEFTIDDIASIDILDFIQNRLAGEISLTGDRTSMPIPSFLPPLKLKPVISSHYIDTWYNAGKLIGNTTQILILGYSFATPDDYFCDMLRSNRNARITIVNTDIDNVARNVCRVFQLPTNRYSRQIIDNIEHRTYDNRIEIIAADINAVDLNAILHG